MLTELYSYLQPYAYLLAWMVGFSVAALIVTLLAMPWFIASIPDDYFDADKRMQRKKNKAGILAAAGAILKNMVGLILIISGIIMLVLPGQGLLTLLIGLILINFPGKYKLEKKLLGNPQVLKSVNWFRRKRGKKEFSL